MDASSAARHVLGAARRINVWYLLLTLILGIFVVRAFYIQVIRYGHYHQAALNDQLKQFEVPSTRGVIMAHQGSTTVPLVLNQKLYTVYADPSFVKDADQRGREVASLIGGNAAEYAKLMRQGGRYVVLARKVPEPAKKALLAKEYPGIGAQQQDYRIYPQGTMAAQLLGFVNNEGKGVYGVEQAMNNTLKGNNGTLKAITDARGVPLAASSGNYETAPQAGKDVTLTVDLGIQKKAEQVLQQQVAKDRAKSGSVVVLDVNTGAVKAMANYPSYDPADYGSVEDSSLFNNDTVSNPVEIGSVMKPLTTAAALNQGVIQPDTTYNDPAKIVVDDFTISNIEEDGGAGRQSIATLLNLSLNTGATWELMQMGGGSLNAQGRNTWYDYMANRYRFGQATGIEQGYEAEGFVPSPKNNGAGINLTYANTSFGQAMTATTLQVAGAMAATINGGTYYKPHLVDALSDPETGETATIKPQVLKSGVVSAKTSSQMIPLMQYVVDNHSFTPKFDQSRYTVGGKTGTAQIAKPGGGYYDDQFNGSYIGFVGGDKPQYVIAVTMIQPQLGRALYAGTASAQPVFGTIAHYLLDDAYVTPKK